MSILQKQINSIIKILGYETIIDLALKNTENWIEDIHTGLNEPSNYDLLWPCDVKEYFDKNNHSQYIIEVFELLYWKEIMDFFIEYGFIEFNYADKSYDGMSEMCQSFREKYQK